MKTKLLLSLSVAIVAFAVTARAQSMSGTVSVANGPFSTPFATASSFTEAPTNVIETATGDFAGIVPLNSELVSYSGAISGLSSTPATYPINDYLFFSVENPYTGAPGTSPTYRFNFNLQTLAEDSYNPTTGVAVFTGTGTLVDTTGAYQDTPADLTVDFSSANDYTLTLDVPEPATVSLLATGLLGVLALRRRKA